jgi:hypothetical protein
MAVTFDSRGNNVGLSVGIALHKALTEQPSKTFLLCAFGSGPAIACGLYVSLGTEKVETLEEGATDDSINIKPALETSGLIAAVRAANSDLFQTPSASPLLTGRAGLRPFTILTSLDFDRVSSATHKILAKTVEDVEVFSLIIGEFCEFYIGDGIDSTFVEILHGFDDRKRQLNSELLT